MKRLLAFAVLTIGSLIGGAAMPDEAHADRGWNARRGNYDRYWRNYDRWYSRSYRPYYNYYYSRPYYNDNSYYRGYYSTPRYGYYGGGGVDVGPVRIFW
jgi:hypothetical protein